MGRRLKLIDNKRLLNEAEYDMNNCEARGGCHPPRRETKWTTPLWNLPSWLFARWKQNIVLSFIQNISKAFAASWSPSKSLFKIFAYFSAISEHKCMFLSCSYSSKSSWDPLSKIWGYSFYYLKYKNPAILCSFTKLLHHFLSSALTQKHLSSRATVLREVNDCIWQYTIIDLRVTSMMV